MAAKNLIIDPDALEHIAIRAEYAHGLAQMLIHQRDFGTLPGHQQQGLNALGEFTFEVLNSVINLLNHAETTKSEAAE